MSVFKHSIFLIVDTPAISGDDVSELTALISRNGGSSFVKLPQDTLGAIEANKITHIITASYDFAEYDNAMELLIPVTSSQWVYDSVNSHPRNYKLYSPVPLPFMDRVVLCIADNLPEGDRELMYAGIRAFGGQFLDALSRYTTHLVAVDLSNNKSVVATNIKVKEDLEIKIVLPHWVDACITQQKHVDETPYLLSDPVVLQTGKPHFVKTHLVSPFDDDYVNALDPTLKTDVLKNKKVHVANDYNLSEHFYLAISDLITLCGASIEDSFGPNIDVYIGKYRQGQEFKRACTRNIDVASLQWVYHLVMAKKYTSPLKSNLLHFPIPNENIPEFMNLRISVTGYTGDARYYLSLLISYMGAEFTKTLDSENDILVCGRPVGDKYDAVKEKWTFVKVVNHLWIEECFAQWKYLPPTDPRYTTLGSEISPLGRCRLKKADINKWVKTESEASGIDDSANEEEIDGEHVGAGENKESKVFENRKVEPTTPSKEDTSAPSSPLGDESTSATKSPTSEIEPLTSTQEPVVVGENFLVSEHFSPAGRASRSAKEKASRKLHSNMEDLNAYTSMSKSVKKMSAYMEELEKSTTPKKREATPEKVNKTPMKKQKSEVQMIAIMTGCEQELVLNRSDIAKLAKVGIVVVNDYSSKKHIDTIIAPKILRTEKFLKSLSRAKQILHPLYFANILKRLSTGETSWEELAKEYNASDFSLDKVVSAKQMNEDLGFKGSKGAIAQLLNHDRLTFEGFNLNLSANLNGGADLIASILKEHGLRNSKIVKPTGSISKSGLLANDDGTSVLVAHKTKDKKVAQVLENVIVVDWDWCVRSIFHGKLEEFKAYLVK